MAFKFDVAFLLDLDAISLTRLMDKCRDVRKNEILEHAIAMRNAMNADEKQFKTFMGNYSTEEPVSVEDQKVSEGRAALARLFGGGR